MDVYQSRLTEEASAKIEIRCTPTTKTEFKKVAAEIGTLEDTVLYLVEHFAEFQRMYPPRKLPHRNTKRRGNIL